MHNAMRKEEAFSIRKIHRSEVAEIISWWKEYGEMAPEEGMMPLDSTFVLDFNGSPLVSITVFLTNSICAWVDNFIAHPGINFSERSRLTDLAWESVQQYVKDRGYKRMLCFSDKQSKVRLYERYGFQPTLSGVVTMTKEVV